MLTFQDFFFLRQEPKPAPPDPERVKALRNEPENDSKTTRPEIRGFGEATAVALFDLMSSLGAGRPEVPLGKGGKHMKKWQFTSLLLLIFFIDTNAPIGQKQEEGTWLSDFMHEKVRLASLHELIASAKCSSFW